MEGSRDPALVVDLAIDVLDLLGAMPQLRRDVGRAPPFVPRLQHHIQGGERQGKEELLLRLGERIRVGGGRARPDRCGHAERLGQLIDLGLVQMRDRLHVSQAVATLHEESLVVLQPVGRADDRVVQAVGVVVGAHGAHPLFEVRCGHDLAQLTSGQADLPHAAGRAGGGLDLPHALARCGGLHRQITHVEPIGIQSATVEHQLGAPPHTEIGHEATDGGVAPVVASARLEHGGDVLHDEFDSEPTRPVMGQHETLGVRFPLRQAEPQDVTRAHRLHGKCRTHRAVHTTAHRDDHPGTPQRLAHFHPQRVGDPARLGRRIEL